MRSRLFSRALPLLLLGVLYGPGSVLAGAQMHEHNHEPHSGATDPVRHPEPREGITGDKVLPADQFTRSRAHEAYSRAREIPQVLDGLHCHCDCHDRDDLRSLLSCFENDMASTCGICMGEARLAYRLHKSGKSLDEIRSAVDTEYGR